MQASAIPKVAYKAKFIVEYSRFLKRWWQDDTSPALAKDVGRMKNVVGVSRKISRLNHRGATLQLVFGAVEGSENQQLAGKVWMKALHANMRGPCICYADPQKSSSQ
jgi:hypothetical protein